VVCPGAKPGAALSAVLKGCKRDDPDGKALLDLLRPLEKDAKALDVDCKQILAADRDGTYSVTVEWLKQCIKQ